MNESLQYTGRVVLITGGSKGIGSGCAMVFVRAGASVVICARDSAEALAQELTALGPGRCVFRHCDVSKPAQIQHLIAWTVRKYGRLDCLVNNAGRHPPHKPIDEFSVKDFQELLQLNLVSYFAAAKFALPHLRKTKGNIINMGSLVGMMGQEMAVTYCAAKAGISGLTKAMAIDEAQNGVRVNALLPGNVLTESRSKVVQRTRKGKLTDALIDSWQWMGRSATVEEIGQACLFLASDSASYITGIELILSGGSELGFGIKAPKVLGLRVPSIR